MVRPNRWDGSDSVDESWCTSDLVKRREMNETRRCEDEGPLLPCLGANAPCIRGGGGTAVAGVGSGITGPALLLYRRAKTKPAEYTATALGSCGPDRHNDGALWHEKVPGVRLARGPPAQPLALRDLGLGRRHGITAEALGRQQRREGRIPGVFHAAHTPGGRGASPSRRGVERRQGVVAVGVEGRTSRDVAPTQPSCAGVGEHEVGCGASSG